MLTIFRALSGGKRTNVRNFENILVQCSIFLTQKVQNHRKTKYFLQPIENIFLVQKYFEEKNFYEDNKHISAEKF